MIQINDLEWAAGFLEAEGCFHFSKWKHLSVTSGQLQKEPLERLQQLFGGGIYSSEPKRPGEKLFYRWVAVHARGAGIAMTLYPLLSPKRQTEIHKALGQWKAIIPQGYRTHCPQGHPYSGDNLYLYQGTRNCKECRSYKSLVGRGYRKPEWKNRHPGERLNFQCKRGHAYAEENIYEWRGKRYCKECRKVQMAEWRRAHRVEAF